MTTVLQVSFITVLIALVVVGLMFLVGPIHVALTTSAFFRAAVLIVAWLLLSGVAVALVLGAIKRWRWAFWANLLFFAYVVVTSALGPNKTFPVAIADAITGTLAAAILIMALVALIRVGPWAMKETPQSRPATWHQENDR